MKFLLAIRLLILGILFLCASSYFGQVPNRPVPEKLVNNISTHFQGFLTASETKSIEDTLRTISNTTSNQICIVITDELNGLTAFDFAVQVLNKWGVGQKDKNNGVVVLVKLSNEPGERDLAITVGYGLEGAITDLETKKIAQHEIIPEFKQGNYYRGLIRGCRALIVAAKGEYNTKDKRLRKEKNEGFGSLFIILILVGLFFFFFGRGNGGGSTFGRSGFRHYRGPFFGGFGNWGGGGSSSFGGGDWGGFGGGAGGGGGSSSKW